MFSFGCHGLDFLSSYILAASGRELDAMYGAIVSTKNDGLVLGKVDHHPSLAGLGRPASPQEI